MRAWLCAVAAVVACGNGAGVGDDDTAGDAAIDVPADTKVEPGWTALIERGWSLTAVSENYICRRIKIPADTYVSGFRMIAPAGTHHTWLTISAAAPQLGDYECDGTNYDMQLLYAGGAGTDDMMFPPGVAMKLAKDTYINLNLHVLNLTDGALAGTSGVHIKTLQPSEVVHEADMIFLGDNVLNIPPTNALYMEQSSCSRPMTWTIFNLWPHMHGYAKRQRIMLRRAAASTFETVLDAPYDFREQKNYPMTPLQLEPNDELRVECYYVNNTNVTQPPGYTITYGDSATAEMCYTGLYKYPKGGSIFDCVIGSM